MSLQIKKMHLSIIKGQNEQGKNIEFIYSRKLSGRYSLLHCILFNKTRHQIKTFHMTLHLTLWLIIFDTY